MTTTGYGHTNRRSGGLSARWRKFAAGVLALGTISGALAGCRGHLKPGETIFNNTDEADEVMRHVDEYDEPVRTEDPIGQPIVLSGLPKGDLYREISAAEVIPIAMANSQVLRDLNATLIRTPALVSTEYQLRLQESDPRFGIEAALSQFDAQLNATAFFQGNDRQFNNTFFGGGTNSFVQKKDDYIVELSKFTATGGTMALRSLTDFDSNNAPGNLFTSAWQQQYEAEIRQPLLQGGGMTFNRIAGPGATPGVYNGVLIAKVNNDINGAQFEGRVRDYLSDVVNAYWDLYFSYRDLATRKRALKRSEWVWQKYKARADEGAEQGLKEAVAREQFYQFQAELKNAITGRTGQRTQNFNGTSGGSFRGLNGVLASERRLRFLIGLPISDGQLLRPSDQPEVVPIVFDWEAVSAEGLRRRPELKQQRLVVRRRELELIASRNFMQPRLDAVALYRLRGLGDDLAGRNSAYSELSRNEYSVGVEYSMPLGFRQAHAAVQNAEFLVSREVAVLKEQERQVIHDMSAMMAEVDRAYELCQVNFNRFVAAQHIVEAMEANLENGIEIEDFNLFLDAQRRVADAETQYHLSRAEYEIALKNMHFEKGSILEYCDLTIMDGQSGMRATIPAVPGANGEVVPQPEPALPPGATGGDEAPAEGGEPVVKLESGIETVSGTRMR